MSEQSSDAELVQEALRGRGEAFGELVARYRDAVFGVAFHRLGDFEEARDVAQDAFLKAYLNLAELRDPAAFASWLYRIADGTAVDAARRSRREVSLTEAEEVPDPKAATAEQSDIARQVQQALAGLGEQSRLAVILHYVNGYTHAEIARFLGATPQAVKTRLSRARGRLREEMAEMTGERIKKAARRPKLWTFKYTVKTQDGKTVEGTSVAPSAEVLVRRLGEKGYFMQKLESTGPASESHQKVSAEKWDRETHPYYFEAVPNDKPGTLITGTRDATSPRALRQTLEERGYTVTKVSRRLPPELEEDPIIRIIDVILTQAAKDGAVSVRIEQDATSDPHRVLVHYLIADTWHEVMSVPMYIWDPLRGGLADLADLNLRDDDRRQMGTIRFSAAERQHEANATFRQRAIKLDLAPTSPSTP